MPRKAAAKTKKALGMGKPVSKKKPAQPAASAVRKPAKVADPGVLPAASKPDTADTNDTADTAAASKRRFDLRQRWRDTRSERRTVNRKLAPAWQLYVQAFKLPARHWEIFGGILLIYSLINLLLIGGVTAGGDLSDARENVSGAFSGQFGELTAGLALFGFLITNSASNAASGLASAYQMVVLLLTGLAIIWSLRQVYAGKKIRLRDAFYSSMYPLVQQLLVILVIALQLLPATIGGFLMTTLVGGGIVQTDIEVYVVTAIFFVLVSISAYLLCSSLFALYIVTLPDMTPLRALRSSRDIVRHRRGIVLRKLLFLPFAMMLTAAVIMVPLALWVTPVAVGVFFVLTVLAVLIFHSYMYALYRELIA